MGSVSTGGNRLAMDTGSQRARLPVYDSKQGTGNSTETMDHPMREIFFSNDYTLAQTLLFTGPNSLSMTFVLNPGETLDERLPEFSQFTITAGGAWRYYVRSGRIE